MITVSIVCILLIAAGFWSQKRLERHPDRSDFKANICRFLVAALPFAIITLVIAIVIFILIIKLVAI